MRGGGGSNTRLKKCKISLVSIFLFSVSFGVADSYLDERLQKLEKQRQSLEAKIQREAQNKEIKAQKQAKAKEEKQRKDREAKEKREAKQAQKRELREAKRQQRYFHKDESTALLDDINTSQESKIPRYTQYTQSSIYTNPNDRNGWFIAFAPKVSFVYMLTSIPSNALESSMAYAQYGVGIESGYLFGSGLNSWRAYFGVDYGYSYSNGYYRGDYYRYGSGSTEPYTGVDLHFITHSAGLDLIPRFGNSFVRGVLGFRTNFSYILAQEKYDLYSPQTRLVQSGWGGGYTEKTYVYAGVAQNNIHLLLFGISNKIGVIFDIGEYFSIETGSRLNLNIGLIGWSRGIMHSTTSLMVSLEQYLSLAYRF